MARKARLAAMAATIAAAIGGGAQAQGGSGEQTYLVVTLEKVRMSTSSFDWNISEILAGNGNHFAVAQVSAASREAVSKLKSQLAGRTGTAEVVVCVPPGSQTCIKIVCRLCSPD
jgi:hypothetical protein